MVKMNSVKYSHRWVVKVGSNMLCSGGPLLIRAWMKQVSELKSKHGIEVVWVSSGAIASAVDRTRFKKKQKTLPEKQALSAIGQPLVIDLYNIGLQTQGMLGAQVLLTYDDLTAKERRQNFKNTINQLLKWDVTPILNENDAVSTDEIKFGDNDSLSAKVAATVNAERLVIMTDVPGLYDSDPKQNPSARLISTLNQIPDKLLNAIDRGSGSSRGSGGMYSKIRAAKEASEKGIETWLVKGDVPDALLKVASGEAVGTRIVGKRKK